MKDINGVLSFYSFFKVQSKRYPRKSLPSVSRGVLATFSYLLSLNFLHRSFIGWVTLCSNNRFACQYLQQTRNKDLTHGRRPIRICSLNEWPDVTLKVSESPGIDGESTAVSLSRHHGYLDSNLSSYCWCHPTELCPRTFWLLVVFQPPLVMVPLWTARVGHAFLNRPGSPGEQ